MITPTIPPANNHLSCHPPLSPRSPHRLIKHIRHLAPGVAPGLAFPQPRHPDIDASHLHRRSNSTANKTTPRATYLSQEGTTTSMETYMTRNPPRRDAAVSHALVVFIPCDGHNAVELSHPISTFSLHSFHPRRSVSLLKILLTCHPCCQANDAEYIHSLHT